MALNRDLANSNQPQCFLGCIFPFLSHSVFSLDLKKKKKMYFWCVCTHIHLHKNTHTNAHTHIRTV